MNELYELERAISVDEKDPVLDVIDGILTKRGHTADIDADHFEEFSKLSDDEICGMMKFIIFARADAINASLDQDDTTERDLFELVRKPLLLMARGWLWCGDDFQLLCAKPIGPVPTSQEWDAITHRIDLAYPLIGQAFEACAKASGDE